MTDVSGLGDSLLTGTLEVVDWRLVELGGWLVLTLDVLEELVLTRCVVDDDDDSDSGAGDVGETMFITAQYERNG